MHIDKNSKFIFCADTAEVLKCDLLVYQSEQTATCRNVWQ